MSGGSDPLRSGGGDSPATTEGGEPPDTERRPSAPDPLATTRPDVRPFDTDREPPSLPTSFVERYQIKRLIRHRRHGRELSASETLDAFATYHATWLDESDPLGTRIPLARHTARSPPFGGRLVICRCSRAAALPRRAGCA
jgi:hypothetical protein